MLPGLELDQEFFLRLEEMDAAMARAVASEGCRHCGGPLHRADYERKPRGALMGGAGERFTRRHSLCCGREGCRRRALPPSLRFLGRKVYLEVAVVLAVVLAQATASARAAARATGVARRTLTRWAAWWTCVFPRLPAWTELRARLAPPPPDETALPLSLHERLTLEQRRPGTLTEAQLEPAVMGLWARLLAPATTASVHDPARFVRAAAPAS